MYGKRYLGLHISHIFRINVISCLETYRGADLPERGAIGALLGIAPVWIGGNGMHLLEILR